MEESILTSIKGILGLAEANEAFDGEITMHINTSFSTLHQLGIGPDEGYAIDDKTNVWEEFLPAPLWFNMAKSYIGLSVRMVFDPPQSGFLVDLMNKQLEELVWRLSAYREEEVA